MSLPDGKYEYFGSAAEDVFGYSAEEFLAHPLMIRDIMHPDFAGYFEQTWSDLIAGKVPRTYEYKVVDPHGKERWIVQSNKGIVDQRGKIIAIEGICRDITARRRAEDALSESEEKHRILFESSRDAIMTLAPPSWGFTSGNPACVAVFGARDEAEFTSFPPWALSPEHQPAGRLSADKAKEMLDAAMRNGSHFFEWTHKTVDGREFPADVLLTRIEFAGQVLLQATVRDITDRKRAEQERERLVRDLRERVKEIRCLYGSLDSVRRHDSMTDVFRDVVSAIPAGWQYPDVTTARIRFDGDEYISEGFEETKWRQSADIVVHGHQRGTIDVFHAEQRPKMDEGPFLKEERQLIDELARNLSEAAERKRTEEVVRESEERMRLAVQNVPVMVDAFDEDGRIIVWNRECERVTGYSRDEMMGNPNALELLYPDPAEHEAVLASIRKDVGDFRGREFTLTNKDGDRRTVSWSNLSEAHPIPGWSTWAVGVDVTERKQSQQQLQASKGELEEALHELQQTQEQVVQQERLRALGEMASGIAHDLNNSLSPVLGYAELVTSLPNLPDDVREWLDCITVGARDAAAVVERLKWFYRKEPAGAIGDAVNLGALLRQIVELTRPKWRDEAQRTGRSIEFDLQADDLVVVRGSPSELRELFTNLVFNAVDAMPSGGRITLSLRVTAEFADVELTDTGTGMSEQVAGRCFDPFFTTKETEGTGLGLSMCHGIVQRHGGQIKIDTEPGRGTTFHILLPLAKRTVSSKPQEPNGPLPEHRLLYIDDDPRLRELAATLFRQLGQQVDVADGGAAGLEMVRANTYDVVVTDLGMPGIDGCEVTRVLKAICPEIPVIMVTGWGARFARQRFDETVQPEQFVSKPLTLTKLRKVLEKVFA